MWVGLIQTVESLKKKILVPWRERNSISRLPLVIKLHQFLLELLLCQFVNLLYRFLIRQPPQSHEPVSFKSISPSLPLSTQLNPLPVLSGKEKEKLILKMLDPAIDAKWVVKRMKFGVCSQEAWDLRETDRRGGTERRRKIEIIHLFICVANYFWALTSADTLLDTECRVLNIKKQKPSSWHMVQKGRSKLTQKTQKQIYHHKL